LGWSRTASSGCGQALVTELTSVEARDLGAELIELADAAERS
jgi:hypothetical protein